MTQVNIHEAKTQLSKLVEAALGGEEVIIARAGKPAVRLVPAVDARTRQWGRLAGKISPEELEALMALLPDEVIDSFYESELIAPQEYRAEEPEPR